MSKWEEKWNPEAKLTKIIEKTGQYHQKMSVTAQKVGQSYFDNTQLINLRSKFPVQDPCSESRHSLRNRKGDPDSGNTD